MFVSDIKEGYSFEDDFFTIGAAMQGGKVISDAKVNIPLKTLTRHGLIAGATGTGKTKSLQVMAEQLSKKGIPSLVMDIKGDLSGLAMPGAMNKHIDKRHGAIGLEYSPEPMPVELLSISQHRGVKLRATISEFGPILLSKILDLNSTQDGVLAALFRYCDNNNLLLLDLKDLKQVLKHAIDGQVEDIHISKASASTILRKVYTLEQQGAENFFGEKSFDVNDLLKTRNNKGVVSIIRLEDMQAKPSMFSTFMLSLLAEIYNTFPEEGDLDKPKLAIFIDEAHLVFDNASKTLLQQIETTVKLIRSKGVGVFFVTQDPTDIPDQVLGQLGLKVQHSLRAFTAKDRKAIKSVAENYPVSNHYDVAQQITALGIGEAFVTALNEKGIPTPLAATMMRAPLSRMGILEDQEISRIVDDSSLASIYNKEIDRKSAYEILSAKVTPSEKIRPKAKQKKAKKQAGTLERISKNTMVRQMGKTVASQLMRGLLGALKKG